MIENAAIDPRDAAQIDEDADLVHFDGDEGGPMRVVREGAPLEPLEDALIALADAMEGQRPASVMDEIDPVREAEILRFAPTADEVSTETLDAVLAETLTVVPVVADALRPGLSGRIEHGLPGDYAPQRNAWAAAGATHWQTVRVAGGGTTTRPVVLVDDVRTAAFLRPADVITLGEEQVVVVSVGSPFRDAEGVQRVVITGTGERSQTVAVPVERAALFVVA